MGFKHALLRMQNCVRYPSVLKNLAQVFQSFANKAGQEQCCPLCTRGFENAAKTDEFKNLILNRIASIPAQQSEAEVTVAAAKQRRSRLQKLGPAAAQHASLVSKAIPEAATRRRGCRAPRGGGDARALVRRSLAGPGHPRWGRGAVGTRRTPQLVLTHGGLKGAMVSKC